MEPVDPHQLRHVLQDLVGAGVFDEAFVQAPADKMRSAGIDLGPRAQEFDQVVRKALGDTPEASDPSGGSRSRSCAVCLVGLTTVLLAAGVITGVIAAGAALSSAVVTAIVGWFSAMGVPVTVAAVKTFLAGVGGVTFEQLLSALCREFGLCS